MLPGERSISSVQLSEVSRKIGLGNRPSRLFLSRSDGAGLRENRKNSGGGGERWLFQEL